VLVLAIACLVSLAAWIYLVAAHGGFWLTGQRLPRIIEGRAPAGASEAIARSASAEALPSGAGTWPDVVAIVPARNEASILPETLDTLLAQDYPGRFRVVVVDDHSDDGTGEVAAGLGTKAAADGGADLTVVSAATRPEGWAGKVWAMHQGFMSLAGTAPDKAAGGALGGDGFVLFTDADIAWTAPGALRTLVVAALADDRQLVSQMVLLRAAAAWERVIVPAFVYFFAQLYPFRRSNDPRSKTAAGAGGVMLIDRAALVKAGGLEPIRGALIDDVSLATLLKKNGNRIWLGLTKDITSARPYPGLADLWHMVARSAYTQLRYNPALLAGTIVGLLFLYAAPPVGAIAGLIMAATGSAAPGTAIVGTVLAGAGGLTGWALMSASYVPMLRYYGLSPLRAPSLPLIAVLYAAMTVDSARRHYSGRAVSWRGRAAERVTGATGRSGNSGEVPADR
jgi:hopene-associated glycosyltransferase HpnB